MQLSHIRGFFTSSFERPDSFALHRSMQPVACLRSAKENGRIIKPPFTLETRKCGVHSRSVGVSVGDRIKENLRLTGGEKLRNPLTGLRDFGRPRLGRFCDGVCNSVSANYSTRYSSGIIMVGEVDDLTRSRVWSIEMEPPEEHIINYTCG